MSSFAVTLPTPVVFGSLPLTETTTPLPSNLLSPPPSPPRLKALELPEILTHIGRFLSQHDALSCVLVSRAWHEAFQPVLWGHIETANDISPEDIASHAHYIKSLSLADLTGLGTVLEKCTRLETLILWPDAFENEEDEEDDDDDDEEQDEDGDKVEGETDQADIGQQDGGGNGTTDYFQSTTEMPQLNQLPQPPPPLSAHPMDEFMQQDPSTGVASNHHTDGTATSIAMSSWFGTKEGEKVRRDSGVGDDTVGFVHEETDNLNSRGSADTSVELLGIQGARSILPKEVHEDHKYCRKPQSPLAKLISRNHNLTRVEVYVERKSPGGSFWRSLAGSSTRSSSCPRLSAFQSLVNLQVYKHIKPFLQMCTRLESLDLERCSLRQLDASYYTSLTFSRMKELRFGRIKDTSLQTQLLIMRQCPELRSLDWRVTRLGFPVEEFCEALRNSWPKLKSLVLPESRLTDSELAQILRCSGADTTVAASSSLSIARARTRAKVAVALETRSRSHAINNSNCNDSSSSSNNNNNNKGLVRFEVRRSDFANESYRALKGRGHFETLRNLDLYQCPGLASWMIAEILKGCPLLESFDGHQLFARDIVSSSNIGHSGSGNGNGNGNGRGKNKQDDHIEWWVCRGMRFLDLHITGLASDPEQDVQRQWQIFAQLARLEELMYLSVGGKSSRTLPSSSPVITTESEASFLPAIATTFSSPPSTSLIHSSASSSSSSSAQPASSNNDGVGSGGLDLRLRSGLGQLWRLKKLRMLRFTGSEQQMTEQDVMWMIENLPELKIVQGKMHTNAEEQEKLEMILENHRISAWTMYNQPYARQKQKQTQSQQQQQQQQQQDGGV
ncbi:hypothetical protein BGX27_009253 [Mortierella sp. AM989]|nr:hypothetical protein BGX27_009253 [Mortierella sp. AM989]